MLVLGSSKIHIYSKLLHLVQNIVIPRSKGTCILFLQGFGSHPEVVTFVNCDFVRSLHGSPLVLSSVERLKGYVRLKIEDTVGNLTLNILYGTITMTPWKLN